MVSNWLSQYHNISNLYTKGAVFGLEFSEYIIEESDKSFVVSILLVEKDLAMPISLQLTTTDVSASKC